MDSTIQSLLFTPTEQIFTPQLKTAWNTFRVVGVVLILITGLVMVISQAIGLELFDAYTVKKILPRLLIAAIGISLSWPIMQFVITLFNDLGLWAHDIILYPFKDLSNLASGSLYTGGALITGGIGVGMVALGVAGILSLLGTIVLALLIGLLVLSLRQIIILMAVLMAPLAIAAYILPGTQKLWEFWKNTFLTALYMFPIIMAFLAGGKALAAAAASVPNTQMQLLSVLVYFAPYFLLPFAFKLAGGLMATVFSIANDKNRGAFDRLKKGRQATVAGNLDAMKRGNRFKSENWAAKGFNATTRGVAAVPHAGVNPRRWKSRTQSAMSTNTMEEAAEFAEKNQAMRTIINNDDFLHAGIDGKGSDSNVRALLQTEDYGKYSGAALEQGVAAIRAARRAAPADVFETAAAMALPATGTAFKGGAGEMHNMINHVAGNDRVRAGRMLAAMRSGAGQARRFDLAGGGFGDQIGVLEEQFKGTTTTVEANNHIFESSLEGQGGSYIVGGRKKSVENMA